MFEPLVILFLFLNSILTKEYTNVAYQWIKPSQNFNSNIYTKSTTRNQIEANQLEQFSESHFSPQIAPDNNIRIYLNQERLSMFCIIEHNSENIIWKRIPCPYQMNTEQGELIANGSTVHNPQLYGINLSGRNGQIVSELLLKQVSSFTDGLYICESNVISNKYPHNAGLSLIDVFIIGGKYLLKNCYQNPPCSSPVYHTYSGVPPF